VDAQKTSYFCGIMKWQFWQRSRNIHILAWLSIFGFGLVLFSIYYPLRLVGIHAFANLGLLMVLFYGGGSIVNRFIEQADYAKGIFWAGILFILISYLRVQVNWWLSLQYFQSPNPSGPLTAFGRIVVMVLATSSFIGVLGLSYQMLLNRFQKERQTMALLQEQQTAQLDFLKAQINPHFLFNALNNIYSLVELRSPDAPKMLLKLSDLLRYVIYEGRKKEVSLQKEVQQIHTFIELFQMRNEHPVQITFEVDVQQAGLCIEPMILIPLVENCFKHADFGLNPMANTVIQLSADTTKIRFRTQNTFNQSDVQKDQVGGVGLENIAHRLQLRYPNRHKFSYGAEGAFFVVLLEITTP
jgi:hypothetical protein